MKNLIAARMRMYFHSVIYLIGMLLSFFSGLYGGISAYLAKEYYVGQPVMNCPFDDFILFFSLGAVIGIVTLCAGREFSDGTIRNKLVVGYTKPQVFLAESVAALVMMLPHYFAVMLPWFIGGNFFFAAIPLRYAVEWIVALLGLYVAVTLISVTFSYLIAQQAIGVIVAVGLCFGLYSLTSLFLGYYQNIEPREVMDTWYTLNDDGTYTEKEEICINRYYLPDGIRKGFVYLEHYVNPFSAMSDLESFGCALDKSELSESDMQFQKKFILALDMAAWRTFAFGILLFIGGIRMFCRKNLN